MSTRKKKSAAFRRKAASSAKSRKAAKLRRIKSKLRAEHIKLDRMGYQTSGYGKGRYYGTGTKIYRVTSTDDDTDTLLRAPSADIAKTIIAEKSR